MHSSPAFYLFTVRLRRGLRPGSLRRFRAGRARLLCFQARPPGFPGSPVSGGRRTRVSSHACIRRIRPCNTGMHPIHCAVTLKCSAISHGRSLSGFALQLTPWDAFCGRRSARLCFRPAASPGARGRACKTAPLSKWPSSWISAVQHSASFFQFAPVVPRFGLFHTKGDGLLFSSHSTTEMPLLCISSHTAARLFYIAITPLNGSVQRAAS